MDEVLLALLSWEVRETWCLQLGRCWELNTLYFLCSEEMEHDVGISATEFTITCGSEVEVVETTLTSVGMNHVGCWDYFWKTIDNIVVSYTLSLSVSNHDFACDEWTVLSLQAKVLEETVVYLLYLVWPVCLSAVGLTLMEEYTFNHTCLLCLACHVEEALVCVSISSMVSMKKD